MTLPYKGSPLSVVFAASLLYCASAQADTLVNYQFNTNNFPGPIGNGTSATAANAPYSSVVNGSFLSSASTIDNGGTAVTLTYRVSGTLVNNGSAAASYPAMDARLTSAAPDPTLYFQFSFTANSAFNLTTLSYDLATGSSSATTTRGADVRFSLDGFNTFTDAGQNGVIGNADSFTHLSLDLGNTAVASGQTVTVRFLPFVDTGAAGGVRFDNIEVDGVSAVPEPGSLAIFGLGGLAAFILRRRRA
jgi:hypothetical protein